jgi:hypothetical protein
MRAILFDRIQIYPIIVCVANYGQPLCGSDFSLPDGNIHPNHCLHLNCYNTEMDLQAVLALIDEAFAGVQRDEDCTLHHAQLLDHTLDREVSEDEWNDAKRRDPETDWRDIPASSIDECDAALSHATLKSWLFYMPAYMRRALQLLDTDAWLPGSVIFDLTYDNKHQDLGWRTIERFRQLTPLQVEAVDVFLSYIIAQPRKHSWITDHATEALNSYWALPASERPRGIEIAR